ncbi:12362_t:CDS:2, partial [Acaulospora morrowiae]
DHECWISRNSCGKCTRKFFQEQPSNWKSGNSEIDKIIRESQESRNNIHKTLEWIPFEQFYDIREIDKGAFSIVYLAYWMDGPLLMKAFPDELKKSQEISVEFINELKVHHKLYCEDLNSK